MKSKRIVFLAGLFLLVFVVSGCGQTADEKEAEKEAVIDKILNTSKEAREDVSAATEKENMKINNSLNEDNMMSSKVQVPVANPELIKQYPFALMKTNKGEIKIKFHGDKAPLAVTNFLQLASGGFYDGVRFHRVIKGFMIQGGDPLSKDLAMQQRWGTGGPGYQFKDELSGAEKYLQGTLAMANSGPNTNGSQFFIVTASPETQLPPSYTVFGEVVGGLDVALEIENVKTTTADRPVEEVVIEKIEVLEK